MKQKRWGPELILINDNYRIIDDDLPRAQAVAINGGQIMAVGDNDAIGELISYPNI